MTISTIGDAVSKLISAITSLYVIKVPTLKKILAAIFSRGHILFEDYPGLGKTVLAKLLARALGCEFRRIQFTPDLLPSDIVGTKIWVPAKGKFKLVKGPIFTNILLADEINRAPPKTQAALLEAMEERQVTIEGKTFKLDDPFIVLATQNPIEVEGTYPLPEALLDRFTIRLSLGYPSTVDEEIEILRRRIAWKTDDPSSLMKPILTKRDVVWIQDVVETKVYVDDAVLRYITMLVQSIRKDPRVLAGPSPRAAMMLMKTARALAVIEGRDYVLPDDVQFLAVDVLSHHIFLKPEHSVEVKCEIIVKEHLARVPVPKMPRAW